VSLDTNSKKDLKVNTQQATPNGNGKSPNNRSHIPQATANVAQSKKAGNTTAFTLGAAAQCPATSALTPMGTNLVYTNIEGMTH